MKSLAQMSQGQRCADPRRIELSAMISKFTSIHGVAIKHTVISAKSSSRPEREPANRHREVRTAATAHSIPENATAAGMLDALVGGVSASITSHRTWVGPQMSYCDNGGLIQRLVLARMDMAVGGLKKRSRVLLDVRLRTLPPIERRRLPAGG